MSSETYDPTEERNIHTFSQGIDTYYEVFGGEVQAMKNFYAAIFPAWTFYSWGGENWKFENAAENFMGDMRDFHYMGYYKTYPTIKPRALSYVGKATRHLQSVDSIDEFKQSVEQHGGQAMGGKEIDEGGCVYMVFKDPDWNTFSVYEKCWTHWTDEELEAMDREVEEAELRAGATSEATEAAAQSA